MAELKGSGTKLKHLYANLQIALNIGFNTQVTFPDNFNHVTGALDVFTLDLVPSLGLNCSFHDFDFISNVYLTCLFPMVLSALIGMSLLVTMCLEWSKGKQLGENEKFKLADAVLEILDGGNNNAELAFLRRSFAALDEDHSGELDKKEVAEALKRAGREPSEKDVAKLMAKSGGNGRGTVS